MNGADRAPLCHRLSPRRDLPAPFVASTSRNATGIDKESRMHYRLANVKELTMTYVPARRIVALMFAALFAAMSMVSAPVFADDDTPAWLVPNASYAGVWKTEGANAAPDLDSQITFGYKGADGNLVFLPEDGKLAILYGVNPIGAPNHSDTNILVTRTADGFRWGQFDPGRNSSEFTCTVSNDGATLTCARHAMFNGREFFNNVEMTRVASGDAG